MGCAMTDRLRLQAILLAKQGKSNKEVQKTLLISRHAFYSWIHKYNDGGLEKLKEYNRGRKEGNPKYDANSRILALDLSA